MRVTANDKKIYKFIEDFGFATVKQIANIFFNNITYKNELAKKRLTCLIEHNLVDKAKSINCSQHIFYSDDKYKRQTIHSIIIMDFYTKFIEEGIDVLEFKREKRWNNGKVISDAFITVKYNNKIQSFILEVQTSNNTYKKNISKYLDEDVRKEIIDYCHGFFPVIVHVDDVEHNVEEFKDKLQIVQLETNLKRFVLLFDTE